MDYTPLSDEAFENLYKKFYENPTNIIAQNICTKHNPLEVCMSHCRIQETHHVFSHTIEPEGKPVTDQKYSGRCWIFASLNVIRIPFMKKYDLDEFEFSQSYVYFWDRIERSYYFLNKMVETARRNEPVNGRLVSYLLQAPLVGGGQWDMLISIFNKHGIVPKKNFPESVNSEGTAQLHSMLYSKLREFSIVLRKMVEDGNSDEEIMAKINEQMVIIYRISGICLGIPQKKFTWEYVDKSKKYHSIGPITPKEFYETYVKPIYNIDDKVCLVHDPRPHMQYNQLYTVDCLGNVIGGKKVIYNNQPIDLLNELCVKSIKNNEAVWFGCDVAQHLTGAVLDLKMHDVNLVYGVDSFSQMTKAERMMYGDSGMNHAMVLIAVSLDDNDKPTKWRVENSWGSGNGEQGYFLMTNDWFKEYVYEIVVDKSIVPKEVMDVFGKEPIVLPVWDPMGTLA